MAKFTEAKLEEAIIDLLADQGYPYTRGTDQERVPSDVLIRADLRDFLKKRYTSESITDGEIDSIIRQLDALNAADLYDAKENCGVKEMLGTHKRLKPSTRNGFGTPSTHGR